MKKIITISLAMSILITIFCVGLNINAGTETKKYKTTFSDVTSDDITALNGITWTKTASVNGVSISKGSSYTFDAFNLTANCKVVGKYDGHIVYEGSSPQDFNKLGYNEVTVNAEKKILTSQYEDINTKIANYANNVVFIFTFNVEELTVEASTSPSETATSTATETATSTASETATSTASETATSTASETATSTASETPGATSTSTPKCTNTTTGKYVLNVSGNTNCNIQIMQGEFRGKITQKMVTSCVNGLRNTKIYYNGKWSKGFTLNQGTNEIEVDGEKVNVYVRRNTATELSTSDTKLSAKGDSKKSYYTYSNGRVLPKTGESSSSKLPFVAGGIAFIGLGIGLFVSLKKRII